MQRITQLLLKWSSTIGRSVLRVILRIERSYWRLPTLPRHIVGWCIMLVLCAGLVGLCWATYTGGKRAGYYCRTLWYETIGSGHAEPEYANDSFWSSGEHRVFELTKKQPKRRPNYSRDFNDLNAKQLAAAERLGLKTVPNREQVDSLQDLGLLVKLRDTRYYKIDRLTHSVPYLVPDAADFLSALGALMQEYNGTQSRFIVTSVLRTRNDIRRLRRQNVNATENSCHLYGTTFDITYNRFDRKGKTWDGKLKEDLARALYDLRASGHCYVKYERHQACFHVTVRPER